MRCNHKRNKLNEERTQLIERDNSLLVQRMMAIMDGNPSSYQPLVGRAPPPVAPSNERTRRQEQERIVVENQSMVLRLHSCRPTYDRHASRPTSVARLPRLRLPGEASRASVASSVATAPQSARGAPSSASHQTRVGRWGDRDLAASTAR